MSDELGDAVFAEAPVISVPQGGDFDTSQPHPARIYDYLLGGKDNFLADREVAQKVAQVAPWVISGARGNRAFLGRVVRYLAQAGVRQFLDVGSGLPSSGNVHEIAQAVDPGCRVVYVDRDPVVLVHARALLAKGERTIAVAGDARDPRAIFADPSVREHLDLSQPVAVLFAAIILSRRDDHGCDLHGCVEDGVVDAAAGGCWSCLWGEGSLLKSDVSVGRGRCAAGLALVSQGAGELATELVAFVS